MLHANLLAQTQDETNEVLLVVDCIDLTHFEMNMQH